MAETSAATDLRIEENPIATFPNYFPKFALAFIAAMENDTSSIAPINAAEKKAFKFMIALIDKSFANADKKYNPLPQTYSKSAILLAKSEPIVIVEIDQEYTMKFPTSNILKKGKITKDGFAKLLYNAVFTGKGKIPDERMRDFDNGFLKIGTPGSMGTKPFFIRGDAEWTYKPNPKVAKEYFHKFLTEQQAISQTKKFATGLSYDRAEPNWDEVDKTDGFFLTYELPQRMKIIFKGVPLKLQQPIKAIVQIALKPFAKGKEPQKRLVYYGRDVSSAGNPIDIVMKKYTTTAGFIIDSAHYENAMHLQTIAAYLASIFSGTLEEGNDSLIKFLKGQMFTCKNPSTGRDIYMSCERRYPDGCDFLRFTNNCEYLMLKKTAKAKGVDPKFVEQLMAFSHWTYQISNGYLMVVDFQGIICTDGEGNKNVELTDPTIHCTEFRFGRTNLGSNGMKSFFNRHICNQFCAKMGLTLPPASLR